jgi:hypothetical protein
MESVLPVELQYRQVCQTLRFPVERRGIPTKLILHGDELFHDRLVFMEREAVALEQWADEVFNFWCDRRLQDVSMEDYLG